MVRENYSPRSQGLTYNDEKVETDQRSDVV